MATLANHLLLRVAGLPFASVERFRARQSLAIAERLDTIERDLADARAGLCARLHDAAAASTSRHALLELKRAVFNDREAAAWTELAQTLDESLVRDLRKWETRRRDRDVLRMAGESASRHDGEELRAALAETCSRDDVRHGISFAQPQLRRDLDRVFFGGAASAHTRRKVERAALAYCWRMATKTSPFSTFTTLIAGRFAPIANAYEHRIRHESVVSMNAAIIAAVDDVIVRHPAMRFDLPLVLNPTAVVEGNEIALITARAKEESIFAFDETLTLVGSNPLCEAIAQLVRRSPGRWTASRICDELRAPSPAARERITQLVAQLMDCGLLRPALEYDANAPDALEQLSRSTALQQFDLGQAVADDIAQLNARVSEEHDLPKLRAQTETLLSRLGRAVTLDEQRLVHHRCYGEGELRVDREMMRSFEDDLERVHGVLPLFNSELGYERMLRRVFLRELGPRGRCRSVSALYQRLRTSLLEENGGDDTSDPFDLAAESDASAAEQSARALAFGTALRALAAVDAKRIEVPRALFDEHSEAARPFAPRRARASAGYLAQFGTDGDARPRLVLNQVTPGYGALFGRVAADANGSPSRTCLARSLRASLMAHDAIGEAVELVGTFGVDGQIRPRLLRRLVYGAEAARSDAADVIAWSDVGVEFCEKVDAPVLVLRESGTPILPISGGILSPRFLPPFFRFLTAFGPAFAPALPLLDVFEQLVDANARDDVRHYARLELGGVVLMRETWCFPHASIPRRAKRETNFEFFRRLRAWARDADLPRRVFATPMRIAEFVEQQVPAAEFRRLHKPIYLDFDDLTSAQIFEHFVTARPATLTIAEMLPQPDELLFEFDGARHVSECLFELTSGGAA